MLFVASPLAHTLLLSFNTCTSACSFTHCTHFTYSRLQYSMHQTVSIVVHVKEGVVVAPRRTFIRPHQSQHTYKQDDSMHCVDYTFASTRCFSLPFSTVTISCSSTSKTNGVIIRYTVTRTKRVKVEKQVRHIRKKRSVFWPRKWHIFNRGINLAHSVEENRSV